LQKRVLGQTGLTVSVIGLGTVKWGRNQDVKYPVPFDLPSDQAIGSLLACAVDLGLNLIDTAPAYGTSEERLGQWLSEKRHHWVITTKVGETYAGGQSFFDFSPAAIRKSIECSLQRLKTDYLDIVLVHSHGEDERLIQQERVFATLDQLKSAGLIRAYGLSAKTKRGGYLAVDQADLAMVTFNPLHEETRGVIAYAKEQQKGIFIKKALCSGHLSAFKTTQPITEAMRFVLTAPGVTSVVIGTMNHIHLQQVVRSAMQVLDHL
jgi:aryl-alcohol dehydrogenase-like predicted oxidoreductase